MQCAICHDDVTAETGRSVMSCGHVFHIRCLTTWLQKPDGAANCPCCRKEPTELERLIPVAAESEETDDTPLMQAIIKRDVAEARRIIMSCTTDVDEIVHSYRATFSGHTALMYTIVHNQGKISSMLLTAGASLLGLGPTLDEALLTACEFNSMACIQACLAQGADINYAQPLTGNTPLMGAIKSPFDGIVTGKFLISMGANVTAVDAKGWNALMWAAHLRRKAAEWMTLLLEGTALEPRIKESVAATKVQALWRGFRVRRPRLRRGIRGHVRFIKICYYRVLRAEDLDFIVGE